MGGHHRRQRRDGELDPLAGRDQSEGRQHRTALEPFQRDPGDPVVRRSAAGRVDQDRRGTVRQHPDPLGRHDAGLDDHPPGGLGEDRDQRRPATEGPECLGLSHRRCRQHRVQRDHQRLIQLLGQRHDERSGLAAEDAVLVLDQDDVGAPRAEGRRHRGVVAAHVLTDRGHDLRLGDLPGSRRMETISTGVDGSAARSASRRSWENIPMPQGRGG